MRDITFLGKRGVGTVDRRRNIGGSSGIKETGPRQRRGDETWDKMAHVIFLKVESGVVEKNPLQSSQRQKERGK